MIRKMTLNKVKNYIKENNLFNGYKLGKPESFDTLFYLVKKVDGDLQNLLENELCFSLKNGFLSSRGYLNWEYLTDITKLDNFLQEYEHKRFEALLNEAMK